MLSPYCTLSTEDDESCAGLKCDFFPSHCTTLGDTTEPPEPAHVHDDIVFDQYLRSPSPSPSLSPSLSPDDAASKWSGATLIDAVHDQSTRSVESSKVETRSPVLEHSSEDHKARHQEHVSHLNTGSRIRLQVNQPKITLHLKLPAPRQGGMKKSKGGKTKTGRKGT